MALWLNQNVFNNIAIPDFEYGKISKGTITPMKLDADMRSPPYINRINPLLLVSLSTVLADNTHDGLSPLCLKSSGLEDNMLTTTRVLNDPYPLITDIISEYGKCVEFKDPVQIPQVFNAGVTDFDATTAPYDIPNNNNQCFIRDCFDGTWIPGLNNIFDQAGASLKSFIDYHNLRNKFNDKKLKNPIKVLPGNTNPGGIGQQLHAIIRSDRLKYTAYFNYDLLLFDYITTKFPLDTTELKSKVKRVINNTSEPLSNNPSEPLSPTEILVINTVNINFLWCYLMLYCYKCVDGDEFFRTNKLYQTGYFEALIKLTQIRFDSFSTNGDDYISNPYIYYRGSTATNILKDEHSVFLPYIEDMCNQIYSSQPGFGIIENVKLAGGVEYVTSQSMAATCMSQFLKLIFPGRSKTTGDAIKIACMTDINKLFNLTGNKTYAGYGWSILKFSGDSSHIVFGEIMEVIKASYSNSNSINNIEIIYAISERPLLARLLAAGKNVYSAFNSVFSTNFKGTGSENKGLRHAALYIQWDKTKQFVNIVQGLVSKFNEIYTSNKININNTEIQQLIDLYDKFISILSNNLTGAQNPGLLQLQQQQQLLQLQQQQQPLNPTIFIQYFNYLVKTPTVDTFLTTYNKIKLESKLTGKITNVPQQFSNLVIYLGGGNRGAGHTNWLMVMKAFSSMGSQINNAISIQNEFDSMYEIVNLLVEYYIEINGLEPQFISNIFLDDTFQKIFKKIINAHTNKISSGVNSEKISLFRQTREEEWRGESKGNGYSIPGKVDSIIGRMETLLINCFKLYNYGNNSVVGMLRGGKNDNRTKLSKQIGGILREEIISTKEYLIDTLTNGQFYFEFTVDVNGTPQSSEVNYSNVLTYYPSNFNLEQKIEILKNEYERLNNSLLPFIENGNYLQDSYNSDKTRKSNFGVDQIFANRLKNLDITNVDVNEFTTLFENEKRHLLTAINFIYLRIKTPTNNVDQYKNMVFTKEIFENINTTGQYMGSFNIDNVGKYLRSLLDMRKESGITYKNTYKDSQNNDISLSLYFNNIGTNTSGVLLNNDRMLKHNKRIRAKILRAMNLFFPNLQLYNNIYFVLYTLEQLSIETGGFTLKEKTENLQDILDILNNRKDVAKLISTLGPQMAPLELSYNTRATRWIRFLNYIKNTEFKNNNTTLYEIVSSIIGDYNRIKGGISSVRRRNAQPDNKTRRKFRRQHIMTSSTSRETKGKKKTKNINRSKKNKTRRKQHY